MIANSLPFKVQITWWLKPVRLCLPENSVCPGEAQFQVGMSVPSTTREPGAHSASFSGFTAGSRNFSQCMFNKADGSGNGWL